MEPVGLWPCRQRAEQSVASLLFLSHHHVDHPKTDLHVFLISSLRRVQVITIAGPESASRSNFDARVICQRIQESPARGFIPEAIYQVDIPNTAKVLKSLKGLSPSTSTPVVGPLQQQFFANIQPGRIYLAAYLKASPTAAVAPKRKPSADIKRDDAKKSCNTHTIKAAATRRHVNLTPVDVGIKGYDRHPLYITGRFGEPSAPCSDFRQQLYPPIGHRYLFPDFSLSIRELLDSSGDNTSGVYTPMPFNLDAASFSSMLTACVDISSEDDYPETIGKLLEIAPHESAPSSYPHSKDFVMEFDFTDFAFDSLTSKMFKRRLHQRIKSGVEDFITKYDKWLHFGHAGTFLQSTEGSGRAAPVKVLASITLSMSLVASFANFSLFSNISKGVWTKLGTLVFL
ncbi:hypothetical protein CPB85DRAFT_1436219 [Mucidula mucida]|nr:hypothetical protein CPB85DRAFT_1436219 [Mucidula mucida]